MDFLSIILLKVIKRFDAQRSLYGALHILNGKKSVQAIQDSRLFHIESMYGLLRFLTREMVKDCAHRLERELLIEHIGNDYFQITNKGKAVIEEECKKRTIPQFHHFNYELNELFWKRLALTIQSITSLKVKKEFVPVIKDKKTQQWVKTLFITNRVGREKLNNQLYKEIKTILSGFSELEATIFVMRMTGPVRIGFTIEQISYLLNEDPIYIHVLFQAVIQRMIVTIRNDDSTFPFLSLLISTNEQTITESAEKTHELLKRGKTPIEISRIRNLKINTIEDHIVEIALNVQYFSIEPFVSKRAQQQILAVLEEVKTKKLREIKEKVDKEVSYFSIRLTLAKKESHNET